MSKHSENVAALLEGVDEGIKAHRANAGGGFMATLVFNGTEVAVVSEDEPSVYVYVYDKHSYDEADVCICTHEHPTPCVGDGEADYIYPAASDADAALWIANMFLHLDLPWDTFDA